MYSWLIGSFKFVRLKLFSFRARRFLKLESNCHIGRKCVFWAPKRILVGENSYIGRESIIECNTVLGKNSLLANRVMIIGRNDHDINQVGVPVRFSRCVRDGFQDDDSVDIGDDVWIGAGAIILAPVSIGSGAVVAAGAVVTKDVGSYTVVAGNPARVVRKRFKDFEQETAHKKELASKKLSYSFRGLAYSDRGL